MALAIPRNGLWPRHELLTMRCLAETVQTEDQRLRRLVNCAVLVGLVAGFSCTLAVMRLWG